jgi:hypothetical protein
MPVGPETVQPDDRGVWLGRRFDVDGVEQVGKGSR